VVGTDSPLPASTTMSARHVSENDRHDGEAGVTRFIVTLYQIQASASLSPPPEPNRKGAQGKSTRGSTGELRMHTLPR
jgi:hypothetical protein